jgi:hypothetical protein
MHSEPVRLCAKCRLQIAPYDLSTNYKRTVYHELCFLIVIREEANLQKPRRLQDGLAKPSSKARL